VFKCLTCSRRTTLTRHQNHHTGTLSESEAAAAAALASRPTMPKPGRPPRSPRSRQSTRPASEGYISQSDTPSPLSRPASMSPAGMSPAGELPLPIHSASGWPPMLWQGRSVTSHPAPLHELQPLTPRVTPSSTPSMPSVIVPQGQYRSAPHASHPSHQPPLPPLPEGFDPHSPIDGRRQGTVSPHLSRSMSPHGLSPGWHSPHYAAPTSQQSDQDYFYPPPPSSYFQLPSRPSSSGSIGSPLDRRPRGAW